jgi:iron complex outermembrane receptor protein
MVGATDQLDYVLGLYYFKDEGESRGLSYFAAPLGGIAGKNFDNETSAKAAFAQLTYRPDALDQRLALTLGLRRTLEHKNITYLYVDAGNPLAPPPGVPAYDGVPVPTTTYGARAGKSFSNNSGMVNAAYQLTDDINLFAKYSTGYRSGGFNGDVFNNSFAEETIKQYELGMKSDWWDHRLRVNMALFRYTYDDQQVAQLSVDPDTGRTSTSIMNGGLAKRWGGELEIAVAPIEDLLVSLNYGYIDGDFDRFARTCGSASCIDADRLARRPNSASNQWSLVLDYTFLHLGFADLKGHLETYWQDQSYTSALTTGTFTSSATRTATVVAYEPTDMDERTLVNARLSLDRIELPRGTLGVSLWGKNIFNQDYNTMTINFATLGPVTQLFGEPRTYGLDITYEY